MRPSTRTRSTIQQRTLAFVFLFCFAALKTFAQPFAPTNVYSGWNGSTAFNTIPSTTGNVVTFSQFSRGSGIATGTAVTTGITSNGWDGPTTLAAAQTANKYFEFTITRSPALFNISSLVFFIQHSGTGPTQFQMMSSIDGGATFSLFGSQFSLATSNTSSTQFTITPASPVIPTGTNVIIRMYGWSASGSAGTCRINNNSAVNGTVYNIAVSSITGSPFCVSATTGANATVNYTAYGTYTSGNIFTAELSDASGSFASPLNIGTLSSTSATGAIPVTIPAGTANGSAYRIRVTASTPSITGSNNGTDLGVGGVSVVLSSTNLTCFQSANGTITAATTGNATPFNYAWSPSNTNSPNISGLSAGAYSLTVTDNGGCSATASVTLTEPAPVITNVTSTNVSCNGGSNGVIDLQMSGANMPYTFNWGSNPATTEDLVGVAAGNYVVNVQDNAGCTQTASITLTEPPAIVLSPSVTDVTCHGASTGAVNLGVSGGTGPYTFAWTPSASTQNLSNIPAGPYSVLVTDNSGCTQTASLTVTEPSAIVLTPTVTNVSCNGGSTGAINLAVSGGTGPYSFAWNPSSSLQNLSNLVAGSYSVLVTDNSGCTQTASLTVTEPAAIVLTPTVTNVNCNGGATGAINLGVSGGTGPYSFAWTPSASTQNLSNIPAGPYSVLVTDNGGCTQTASVTVTEPSALVLTPTVTNVNCNGGSTGAINLGVSGGTGPYSFTWTPSASTQNLSNIPAGPYSVLVTDNHGCTQTASVTVTEPSAIVLTPTVTNVNCNGGSTGAINLGVSGGTGPYSFTWTPSASTQNLSNIPAGPYSVLVTDNHGCTQTASATVTQPAAIVLSPTVTNVNCNGGSTGAVNLGVSGGTGPYSFAWTPAASTQNLNNIPAGPYSVLVTDNHGCTQTASVTVTQPSAIVLTPTVTNVNCNGGSTGAVNLGVSGGTGPYSFAWTPSASTQNLSNIPAGPYSVLVTDNHGCTQTASVTVTEPSAIVLAPTVTNVNCNGASTGAVNLGVSGGTGPYSFTWTPSASTQNLNNIPAGPYSVLVTDNHGCTQTTSVTVTEPAPIVLSTSITNASCNGAATGGVDLTVNGGTAPYSYAWTPTATTEDLSSIMAGSYSVLVTDNHGCTQSTSVTVTQPTAISSSLISVDASCAACADGSIDLTVNGGTPAYNFSWSNSGTTEDLNGLLPDTYYVTITDANGCQHTDSVLVDFSTGIATVNATQEIRVYPNPSAGETIHIDFSSQQTIPSSVWFRVFDMSGKEVSATLLNSANGAFETQLALPDGVYIYKIEDQQNFTQSGRLLIIR